MAGIRNRLKGIPIYLEDTVKNEQSSALISVLCQELEKYYGITLTDGTPKKGAVLLRIIHNQEFYEVGSEKDAYGEAPKDCIVQHMTVEDFRLTGMNRFGTKEKEDHNLRKIIQELAIKIDVYQRQMACYDWSELSFSSPITFVTATSDYKDKSKPICYYMLRVLPNGELRFETWMQSLLWDSSEREKIAAAFETPNGKFDFHVKGLVYEDVDNIHVIYDTDRYTLPNMGDLEQILGATRDDERVIAKPIKDAIQEYSDTLLGPEKEQCQEIFDAVSRCGFQASRKELRQHRTNSV